MPILTFDDAPDLSGGTTRTDAGPAAPLRITVTPRDRELAIRTVLGEAGNQPDDGMAAVAAVIRNRVQAGRYGGEDVARVVTKRHAFEPWTTQEGRNKMYGYAPESEHYQRAAAAVDRTFNEGYDPTGGATHFYAPEAQRKLGRPPPSWAKGEPQQIGDHLFYAPEGRVQMAQAGGAAQPAPTAQPAPPTASQSKAASGVLTFDDAPDVQPQFQPAEGAGSSREPTPDMGRGTAAMTGIRQGVTGNFSDELAGGRAAAGGNDMYFMGLPVGALSGIARTGIEALTGGNKATQAYEAARDAERQQQATAKEQYPGTALAGELAGAVAMPIPGAAAMRGMSMGGRSLRSAEIGAGAGALAGAGEGTDLASRATGAATGGVVGAAVGGVASPVLDLAARGAGRAVQEGGRYLFPNVEQRAASKVSNAARSAERIDPQARTRLTPQEAAANPNSVVADIAGEPGRAIARWSANASPEARDTLNSMINPRFEGQAERIVGWLNNTFHYPQAHAQQEAIQQTARQVNNPAYARAMHDGAGGVWDAELQRLAGAPAIQEAARGAIPSLANRGITEGFRAPRQNPITTLPDGRASLTSTPNGNQNVPDLRFWDQVKKNIDAQIGKAERNSDRAKVQELTALNNELTTNLDRLVPSYQQARQGAAHFFGAENALQAGQEFVTAGPSNQAARQALARMSPTERQLFQDGFVSRYIETINKIGDHRNVLDKIAQNPQARERLNIVLGPQRSQELEAVLRIEGIMNFVRPAVQGNSTTARQLVELGAVGSYGGVSAYQQDPQSIAQSLIAGAFVARGRNTDQRVARRVAEMLVSHNPATFQRGLQMVARNQSLMNSVRSLDQRIGRVSGQQGSGVPALQSMGVGRAEQEQQQ